MKLDWEPAKINILMTSNRISGKGVIEMDHKAWALRLTLVRCYWFKLSLAKDEQRRRCHWRPGITVGYWAAGSRIGTRASRRLGEHQLREGLVHWSCRHATNEAYEARPVVQNEPICVPCFSHLELMHTLRALYGLVAVRVRYHLDKLSVDSNSILMIRHDG